MIGGVPKSEMIDEKMYFHPSWEKEIGFCGHQYSDGVFWNEQIFPDVFFAVGYFAVFGHYWMVLLRQGENISCADFIRWWIVKISVFFMIFL